MTSVKQPVAVSDGTFGQMIQWCDDRLNPVLVKDVRCWLKSKKFLVVFFSALTLSLLSTVAATMMSGVDRESGEALFTVLMGGLSFVLVGIVPYLMHDKFVEELSSGSTELVLISNLTPGAFIRGKIYSGISANILFFSAIGPSLMMAYMLGGIDISIVIYSICLLLGLSLLAMLTAMLMATIVGGKKVKILGLFLVGGGILSTILMVALLESASRENLMGEEKFWALNGAFIGFATVFFYFLYTVAASRLSFVGDNRDTRPRIALSAVTFITVACFFAVQLITKYVFAWPVSDDIVPFGIVFTLFVFFFGVLFILNTPDNLSPRLESMWPKNKLILLFYFPGTGRLWAYILIHVAVLFGAAVINYQFPITSDAFFHHSYKAGDVIAVAAVSACLLSFVGVGTFVYHYVLRLPGLRRIPFTRGITTIVVGVIWFVLGLVAAIIADEYMRGNDFLVITPPTAVIYILTEKPTMARFGKVLIGMSPVIIATAIYWFRDMGKMMIEIEDKRRLGVKTANSND